MIVGHDTIRADLDHGPYPVVLLVGPHSVGKRFIADVYLKQYNAIPADVIRGDLTVDTARSVVRHFSTRPFGKIKGANLDVQSAPPAAFNILLKLLEEPPPAIAIFLVTSGKVPLTIASRSVVHRCSYLSDADVTKVLISRYGMSPDNAKGLAACSGGQVSEALASADLSVQKSPILSILKATADGNETAFYAALQKWGQLERELLLRWASEAATKRWRSFRPEESFGLAASRRIPERVIRVFATGVRPKLAAKLALQKTMEENR